MGDKRNTNDERFAALLGAINSKPVQPSEKFLQRLKQETTNTFQAAAQRRRLVGRIAMKTVRWGIPAAAAAALIILAAHVLGGLGTQTAYGMDDVKQLVCTAKMLHIKGYMVTNPPGEEPVKEPMEYWADLTNNRFRSKTVGGMTINGDRKSWQMDSISNGDLMLTLDYGEKSAKFVRLSPFQVVLRNQQNVADLLIKLFGCPAPGKGWTKLGPETLQGKQYDLWELNVASPRGAKARSRAWIDGRTGDLARLETSISMGSEPLRPVMVVDLVQRNVPIPTDVFNLTAPDGFKQISTPENPATEEFLQSSCWGGKVGVQIQTGFALPDGSVIMPYRSMEEGQGPQTQLVEKLKAGDPLPPLAVDITGIAAIPAAEGVSYAARHLAYTQKAEKLYEWAIFVPNRTPENAPLTYELSTALHPASGKANSILSPSVFPVAVPAEKFDALVNGCLAELSDPGKAPKLTLDEVTKLSQSIRAAGK